MAQLTFADANVQSILGPGGPVSQLLPFYEPREPQIKLSLMFERAIAERKHAVTEAETGTGKSFAYLIPAIMAALRHDMPVVVSVPDKNLQNQLVGKDIPFIQQIFKLLGKEVKAVLMKGRGNFVCHYRIDELEGLIDMSGVNMVFRDKRSGQMLDDVLAWAKADDEGDMDSMPFDDVPFELRSKLTIDSDGCLHRKCPFFEDVCRVEQRKNKARGADIIVVNHSLLLRDLQIRFASNGMANVIPLDSDANGMIEANLVIDEAHELEDQATEAFATEVTVGRFKYIMDRIGTLTVHHSKSNDAPDGPTTSKRRSPDAWYEQIATIHDKAQFYFRQINERLRAIKKKAGLTVNPTFIIDNEVENVAEILELLEGMARSMVSPELVPQWLDPDERTAWGRLANTTMKLCFDLKRVASPETDGRRNWVRFAELQGNRPALLAKPIKVGPILRQRMWDVFPTVMATSATLTVGNSFKSWKDRCGAPEALEIAVKSPFDYQKHARIYIPMDVNGFDPSKYYDGGSAEYFERVADEVVAFVEASKGGIFSLFTSRRVLDAVFNLAAPRLEQYPLFYHGVGANRDRLVRDMKACNNGVLFGLKSFWKGVDIQGTSLRGVLIDKLPFPPPGDPVWDARRDAVVAETGNQWAWLDKLSVPFATVELKQGAGRLIRRGGDDHDYGVIAILDTRLVSKKYGTTILNSLPPAPRIRTRQAVQEFYAAQRN